MAFELRQYQKDIISLARDLLRQGKKSIIITAPTGAGKTALAAHMLSEAAKKGMISYFTVHRRELIKQTSLAFRNQGIPHGIIASGFPSDDSEPIQICSIDTLKSRLSRIPTPSFLITDECHHQASAGWTAVKEAFAGAYHIGLTATPERLDGKGLKDCFEAIVRGVPLRWLIDNNYLAPYKYYAPFIPDVKGLKKSQGDYKAADAVDIMNLPAVNGNIVHHYLTHARDTRAVVFGITIAHCEDIASAFRAHDIAANVIHSKQSKDMRDAFIRTFQEGSVKILANVGIITEGFDLPEMETVILARPTQSVALYLQMVGRALRKDGDKVAIILDHAGNVFRHGMPDLIREWNLDGREKGKGGEYGYKIEEDGEVVEAEKPPIAHDSNAFLEEINQAKANALERANKRRKTQEFINAKTYEQLVALGKARNYKSPHYWAYHTLGSRRGKYISEEAYEIEIHKHTVWKDSHG